MSDKTMKEWTKELNKFDEEIIPQYGMSRNQMSAIFDKVKDQINWKNPINTKIEIESEDELRNIKLSIIFFTGSEATFTKLWGNRYSVRAAGYYACIGA